MGEKSVDEVPGTATSCLGADLPTVQAVAADPPALANSTDRHDQALFVADVQPTFTSLLMATNSETAGEPRVERQRSMGKRLRLPGAEWIRERWFARRASRQLLDLYEWIRREEPQLDSRALYARVVMRRSGLDTRLAVGVLRRAEQSLWPWGRDLRFRDLVLYIIVDEFLRSNIVTVGTRANVQKAVARVIPETL